MNLPSIYTIKTYLWDLQRLNDTGEMTNQSVFIYFERIMGRETCCPHQSYWHPLPVSMSLISRLWGQFGGGKHCGVTMLITDRVKLVNLYEELTEVHMKLSRCYVNIRCVWTTNENCTMMRLYCSHYNQWCISHN